MIPPEIISVIETLETSGQRPILVATSDVDLPFVVFCIPTIKDLSTYVAKASDASVGPLMAAIGLSRISAHYPSQDHIEKTVRLRPFVVMRAVQVLLGELGLAARAEKKSL